MLPKRGHQLKTNAKLLLWKLSKNQLPNRLNTARNTPEISRSVLNILVERYIIHRKQRRTAVHNMKMTNYAMMLNFHNWIFLSILWQMYFAQTTVGAVLLLLLPRESKHRRMILHSATFVCPHKITAPTTFRFH